jgi:drug/metabolite transporter (DMT)-like permease
MGELKIIIPFVAAFLYALAALILKQAMARGAGAVRIIFISNWMYVLVFLPFFFFQPKLHISGLQTFINPFLTGLALFTGQVLAYKAIQIGDISVQAPAMGTKILLVAIFTVLIGSNTVSSLLWIASAITVVAIYFLTRTRSIQTERIRTLKTAGLAIAAAASFGISEVLIEKEAAAFGEMTFLLLSMLISGFISFLLIPFFEGSLKTIPKSAWLWTYIGSFIMAFEAALLYAGIAHYGGATQANIIYSSRGVWSIVLIWAIGSWLGNKEREQVGKQILLQRFFGACLLIVTIAFVLYS